MTAVFVRRVDTTLVGATPRVGTGIASVAPRGGVRIRVRSVSPATVA